MTVVYRVIDTVLSRKLSQNAALSLDGLFRSGRERAISGGETLTLELNLEQESIGLRKYKEEIDRKTPAAEEELEEFDPEYEEIRENLVWITGPGQLPGDIEAFYSTGGIEMTGPLINIQFYPNGTSDGIVLKLSTGGFLFLPRQNVPARKIDKLFVAEDEEDQLDFN